MRKVDASTLLHTPVPAGQLRTVNKVGKEAGLFTPGQVYPHDPREWCPYELGRREAWVREGTPHPAG